MKKKIIWENFRKKLKNSLNRKKEVIIFQYVIEIF